MLYVGVHSVCGDLLGSDLSQVGVLVLADQCWDKSLLTQVSPCIHAAGRGCFMLDAWLMTHSRQGLFHT